MFSSRGWRLFIFVAPLIGLVAALQYQTATTSTTYKHHDQAYFIFPELVSGQTTALAGLAWELMKNGTKIIYNHEDLPSLQALRILYVSPQGLTETPKDLLEQLYRASIVIVVFDTPMSKLTPVFKTGLGIPDLGESYSYREGYTLFAVFYQSLTFSSGYYSLDRDVRPTAELASFLAQTIESKLRAVDSDNP